MWVARKSMSQWRRQRSIARIKFSSNMIEQLQVGMITHENLVKRLKHDSLVKSSASPPTTDGTWFYCRREKSRFIEEVSQTTHWWSWVIHAGARAIVHALHVSAGNWSWWKVSKDEAHRSLVRHYRSSGIVWAKWWDGWEGQRHCKESRSSSIRRTVRSVRESVALLQCFCIRLLEWVERETVDEHVELI